MIPLFRGQAPDRVVYRITIKRGAATITSLTLQTDDTDEAVKVARLDFDLQRSQRGATSVVLTDQAGRLVYRFPQHETTKSSRASLEKAGEMDMPLCREIQFLRDRARPGRGSS